MANCLICGNELKQPIKNYCSNCGFLTPQNSILNNSIIRKPFPHQYHGAIYYIICLDIAIYFIQRIFPRVSIYLAMNPVLVIHNGYVWQFVTYMFVHNRIYFLFDMLGLFLFGQSVEYRIGTWEFLLYYFTTGIFAGLFSFVFYFFSGSYTILLIGGGGPLFAVMLAYATFRCDDIVYIWGHIPIRVPIFVLGYTIGNILNYLFFKLFNRNSSTAYLTNVSGVVFGWIFFLLRFGASPWVLFRFKRKNALQNLPGKYRDYWQIIIIPLTYIFAFIIGFIFRLFRSK